MSSCIQCNNSPAPPIDFGPTPIYRTAEYLPPWAIIVIVFGIVLIIILLVLIVCCLCRAGCWCCACGACCAAAAKSDDCKCDRECDCECDRKEKKKKPTKVSSPWFFEPTGKSSKRPQILYRYPEDDAAAIAGEGGCTDGTSGSGYVPRALRLTNGRPKSVRVVEENVGFGDDGRPIYVVDGGRQSVIGAGSTVSSSRLSKKPPKSANMYVLGRSDVDQDVCSELSYTSSRPQPAIITINGEGITNYNHQYGHGGGRGDFYHSASVYGPGHGGGAIGSHSASIQVVGGSPWSAAAPVPSIYPAL